MLLVLQCLIVVDAIELCLYLPHVWRMRRLLAPLLAVLQLAVAAVLSATDANGWGFLALFIALYRTFNLCRVGFGISPKEYLRQKGYISSLWLMAVQSLAITAWALSNRLHGNGRQGWWLLACVQLLVAIVLLRTTLRQLGRTLPPAVSTYANSDLPSISVCIPARNETEVLERCLRSLVASDYQKLEILVLDDCSQDKTSEVIKAFAHDGVRFLHGSVPPDGWLAKNWAYQQLYEEANGKLIVFCGVDVALEPTSLRQLITTLLAKKRRMISVLPINTLPSNSIWPATLLQPIRYAWEMSLPRRLFNRPPVLSTCWVAERNLVQECGSFKAVRSSVSPESHFARHAILTDGYSFVRSTPEMGIVSQKTFGDQLDTAVRTRYPQLHRRPELVLAVTLVEGLGIAATLPLAVAASVVQAWAIAAVSLLAFIISAYTFYRLVLLTYHTARAYPERFRLLGKQLPPLQKPEKEA
jgi:hypothetical protein